MCYLGAESRFQWGWEESFLFKTWFKLVVLLTTTGGFSRGLCSAQQLFPALVLSLVGTLGVKAAIRAWLQEPICKCEKSFNDETANSLKFIKEIFSLKKIIKRRCKSYRKEGILLSEGTSGERKSHKVFYLPNIQHSFTFLCILKSLRFGNHF